MAALALDLRRPPGAFLYNMTAPKLTIDGHDVPATWGVQHYDLIPGGPHRVEIHVPYVFPRRVGRAALDFLVPEEGLALEYMAPAITFAKGNLGAPGEQKSAGFKSSWGVSLGFGLLLVLGYVLLKMNS